MGQLDEARRWLVAPGGGVKNKLKSMATADPNLEPLWGEIKSLWQNKSPATRWRGISRWCGQGRRSRLRRDEFTWCLGGFGGLWQQSREIERERERYYFDIVACLNQPHGQRRRRGLDSVIGHLDGNRAFDSQLTTIDPFDRDGHLDGLLDAGDGEVPRAGVFGRTIGASWARTSRSAAVS